MGQLTGRNVLVVEDDPIIRMLIEDIVADLGGACLTATSVSGAMALIAAERIDVAVLDFNLNGEFSVPVGARLETLGVPFVYATGYGDKSAGVNGAPILAKPFLPADLTDTLARLLVRRPR